METLELAPVAAAAQGCFVLPALSAEIPYTLEQATERSRVLARLALAGEAGGLALPGGTMHTLEEVVAQQWTNYAEALSARVGEGLKGTPTFVVTDEQLQVVIGARPDIHTYRLKPVVEPLEASLPGLGWFIASVLDQARSKGLVMYDMAMVVYYLDYRLNDLDEFTDQCFAQVLLMEEGNRDYHDDTPVSDEEIEALREQYPHWPSEILASVDGHQHLLGIGSHRPSNTKRAPGSPASLAQVKRWLRANVEHPQAACVRAAIAVHAALNKPSAADFNFFSNSNGADTESIGAMCFLVWESPDLLWETVVHAEEQAYSGGDAMEAFARKTIALDNGVTDQQLAGLVAETKDFLNMWRLLEELMAHLPVHGDDDEI